MRSPQPPIPKPAKSSQIPESHGRPGYETPAISAGAAVARRARCPRRKLACFCSAPMAGFYSAVDTRKLIDACETALGVFECDGCKEPLWMADAANKEWVQCQCGELRWRYGKG